MFNLSCEEKMNLSRAVLVCHTRNKDPNLVKTKTVHQFVENLILILFFKGKQKNRKEIVATFEGLKATVKIKKSSKNAVKLFALQWFLTSHLKHITVNKTTWRTTTTNESLFHFFLYNNYFTDFCSTLLDELEKTDSNILNFQTIKLWKYFLVIALIMM